LGSNSKTKSDRHDIALAAGKALAAGEGVGSDQAGGVDP
jgi:hypothetical protein